MEPLRKTSLHDLQLSYGARMGSYAGYSMPLFYPPGAIKEHLHARRSAALFDISHMLQVAIEGPGAGSLLERVCPCCASSLAVGRSKYSFFLNQRGGVIDDLILTRVAEEGFYLVANAANAEKDMQHLRACAQDYDVRLQRFEGCASIALQGPAAEAVLDDHFYRQLVFMSACRPHPGWFVTRSGYTGEDGFEITAPAAELIALCERLLTDERVQWAGLAARNSLRVEAALPLHGQEIDDDISPLEASLGWAIPKHLREEGSYIGAQALTAQYRNGAARTLLGLRVEGRIPVREGSDLFAADGSRIGVITSGVFAASVQSLIALALVDRTFAGDQLWAEVRSRKVALRPCALPFLAHNYKRA